MNALATVIGCVAIEAEVDRELAAKLPQPGKELLACWLAPNLEYALVGEADFHVVAFFEFKRFDHNGV